MIVLSQGFIKSFLASACKKSNNVFHDVSHWGKNTNLKNSSKEKPDIQIGKINSTWQPPLSLFSLENTGMLNMHRAVGGYDNFEQEIYQTIFWAVCLSLRSDCPNVELSERFDFLIRLIF